MHLPGGPAASSSITFAGHERTLSGRLAFVLLGLTCTLGLALFVGLTFSTSTAPAAFPGTNGPIACSGPLGPIPPPANASFLEIFTMDASGAINETTGAPVSQVRLQNNTNSDYNPRYSADGTKIAFIKDPLNNGSNSVWRMNADGTGETAVTSGANDSFVGGWSPDGTQIVFQRLVPAAGGNPANFEVFKVNADGTGLTNLSNNPGSETVGSSDSQPSWSPDGTKIAFQSNRLGSPDIWVMNADGTGARPLTADSYAEESAPEFSPDGQQIAFQSDRDMIPRTTGRNLEIYRMSAVDGSNVTRLTFSDFNPAGSGLQTTSNLSGFDLNPHWSPDGTRIVFHSGRGIEFNTAQWDAFHVSAVNGENPVGGTPAVRLTRRDLNDERCGWGVAERHHLVSVAKEGSGEGTVTAPGGVINCGLDCAHGYAPGATVTLTAVPAAGTGSTFTGFTGCDTTTATTCTVTVDAAEAVTATFADANPRLSVTKAGSGARKAGTGAGTVTSLPSGIACGADCTDEFEAGSTVTLFANPAANSTFDGFTGGGCSGSGSTCTVTVDQAKTVTAIFSGPLLSVRKAGTGVGTVTAGPPPGTATADAGRFLGINCGVDCAEDYAANTQVVLTAAVNASNVAGATGSTFAGFTGGCSSTTATTCTVTMDQAKTITATFVDFPTLTVNKTGEGSGTVTSGSGGLACGTTCSRDFPKDSTVTLTAVPAAGSDFIGFTGCATTPTENTCTVTVDQARAVVARFGLTPAPAAPPPPPADVAPPPPPPPAAAVTPRRFGSLSATVTPRGDLRVPYVFRTSGRLTLPRGVSAADGCSGLVSVQTKGGRSSGVTISTRRVTLSRTCRYTLRVSFGNKRRFGKATRLKITARFLGNSKVRPDTAMPRYVRVPR